MKEKEIVKRTIEKCIQILEQSWPSVKGGKMNNLFGLTQVKQEMMAILWFDPEEERRIRSEFINL